MRIALKVVFALSAAVGTVLLVLGIIQFFNETDGCPSGSHYHRFWLTSAIWFLAAPAGAWVLDRAASDTSATPRTQLIYLGAFACLAGLSVAAWQIDAIDVPWFRDRDFPFGESVGCAL